MKYGFPAISITTLIAGTFTNAVKGLLTAGDTKEPESVSFCELIEDVRRILCRLVATVLKPSKVSAGLLVERSSAASRWNARHTHRDAKRDVRTSRTRGTRALQAAVLRSNCPLQAGLNIGRFWEKSV
jgi:hypothetical protein